MEEGAESEEGEEEGEEKEEEGAEEDRLIGVFFEEEEEEKEGAREEREDPLFNPFASKPSISNSSRISWRLRELAFKTITRVEGRRAYA
eukprot:CAMPEP_0201528640 /NCGR_PEP_ID=MMETSP0161_2-20130828/39045_1 /ASSEMBLY_ACC=CAM_ASM_000251 /TAXON_ID=180227 /ORGANISM="Neoparamoeba aestuarina, Strain SoJaBio B1-5/56/2" /LENGTH=88 /DNA_ID=CAMNT_0047930023 /DNA_START=925 /DNA_END=1191 /DNA_ORIENTATION=-